MLQCNIYIGTTKRPAGCIRRRWASSLIVNGSPAPAASGSVSGPAL